jgi:hypothetical protein
MARLLDSCVAVKPISVILAGGSNERRIRFVLRPPRGGALPLSSAATPRRRNAIALLSPRRSPGWRRSNPRSEAIAHQALPLPGSALSPHVLHRQFPSFCRRSRPGSPTSRPATNGFSGTFRISPDADGQRLAAADPNRDNFPMRHSGTFRISPDADRQRLATADPNRDNFPMPRTARAPVGGSCYHALNRGSARARVVPDEREDISHAALSRTRRQQDFASTNPSPNEEGNFAISRSLARLLDLDSAVKPIRVTFAGSFVVPRTFGPGRHLPGTPIPSTCQPGPRDNPHAIDGGS